MPSRNDQGGSTGERVDFYSEVESSMVKELAADWLHDKTKSEDAQPSSKRTEAALPPVTNPTPYSNDYSKFRRMEAEMKVKEEDDAKKAKEEEELREAQQRCPLDHEHGPECIEMVKSAALGGCSHDHRKEQQLFDMPTKEKLQGADTMRQKANEYLREGNCGLAAVWYRKALLNFDYCFPDTKAEREWFNSSKLKCHVSFAICKYKLEEFDEVLIQARQALRIDPKNVKALYWQGMVYMNYKNDFKSAKKSLMAAYHLCPSDPGIRKALSELKEEKRRYASKTSKLAKTMIAQQEDRETSEKGDGGEISTEEDDHGEASVDDGAEATSHTGEPDEGSIPVSPLKEVVPDEDKPAAATAAEAAGRERSKAMQSTVLKLLIIAVTVLMASLAYLIQSVKQGSTQPRPLGPD
ncbi:hypothetical protein FOZ63_004609 [Perkinsus olseni]|uniref:Uncharacterized protein n=1 Tax=Perkinsus olseni TaxID=32597 RepID=A0A7J6SPG7_PEROL|nr:hypothetical protein FOZ63_004609 [Perkinsus olseni]